MFNVSSLVPLLKKGVHKRKDKDDSVVTQYYWGTLELVVRDPNGWIIVLIAKNTETEKAEVMKLAKLNEVTPDKKTTLVNYK